MAVVTGVAAGGASFGYLPVYSDHDLATRGAAALGPAGAGLSPWHPRTLAEFAAILATHAAAGLGWVAIDPPDDPARLALLPTALVLDAVRRAAG